MAATTVTLNDLEGHSPAAGLFKCNPSNIVHHFSRFQLTTCSRGSSALAELFILVIYLFHKMNVLDAVKF